MENDRTINKQRCKAMIDAGIEDPESQAGIDFCVEYCPYNYCVVVEHRVPGRQLRRGERAKCARGLKKHRVSVDDIALILGKSERTVLRYLKE